MSTVPRFQEYDIALKVNVSAEDYPKTFEHIRDKKALILLMVDLLDFPASVWPGILDLLGKNKSIILVGNKIDMVIPDQKNYVRRITEVVRDVFLEKCFEDSRTFPQVVGSVCVSAKTGFNVERLIDKIFTYWRTQNDSLAGDIYIVGSTNVGKSSLFNLLVDSDLCKVRRLDVSWSLGRNAILVGKCKIKSSGHAVLRRIA